MKKILLVTSFFALIISLNAQQQLLNSGFESWTTVSGFPSYERPNDWNTLGTATSGISQNTSKVSGSDAHGGSYAIKLETKSLAGQKANGIVTTGTINISPPYGVSGGSNYTDRPDSLIGYYKSAPASGDYPTMEIVLYGTSNDTIGWARFEGPTSSVSSYTRFAAPIVYSSSATPSKAIALFSSSNGFNAVVGSILYIDDVSLKYGLVSVNDQPNLSFSSVFPNPANELLNFIVNDKLASHVSVYDVTGKLLLNQPIRLGNNSLEISTLPEGNFVYSIQSKNGVLSTGKFSIIR